MSDVAGYTAIGLQAPIIIFVVLQFLAPHRRNLELMALAMVSIIPLEMVVLLAFDPPALGVVLGVAAIVLGTAALAAYMRIPLDAEVAEGAQYAIRLPGGVFRDPGAVTVQPDPRDAVLHRSEDVRVEVVADSPGLVRGDGESVEETAEDAGVGLAAAELALDDDVVKVRR